MRLSIASTSSLVVATFALGACLVAAQEEGDPVTYTEGRVVYTAVLDPDLDTVSAVAASTIAAGGLGAGLLSTSTNLAGNVVTYSDGAPVGTMTVAPAATTTSTAADGGVSLVAGQTKEDLHFDAPLSAESAPQIDDSNDFAPAQQLNQPPSAVEFIHFQTFERRSPTPTLHSPDQQRRNALEKRQAALGGGGGDIQTTQTSLQSISGYTPPDNTEAPSPSGYSSGSILAPSDIPGYTGTENSQGVSGAAGLKLNPYLLAMGCVTGAAVFVFGL